MTRRSLFVGLVLLAAGCPRPGPIARPYPPPSADQLLAAVRARQAAVPGMSARVRATSWLSGERVRATVNMLVERDGRLRFEAEVSLQGTVATLATDGGTFALLDARKNELSRGPACPQNVASLIRIPLAPAEVAAILLGDARLPAASGATVEWDGAAGADVLSVPDGSGAVLQIQFRGTGADRRLVGAGALAAGGARLWRTAYEDFEQTNGEWLPRTIHFAQGTGSFDDGVEIRFRDRSVGSAAPTGAFTLEPPPGVAVRDVGCGA